MGDKMWEPYRNGHQSSRAAAAAPVHLSALSACAGWGQEELRPCTYDMAGAVVNQFKKRIRTKQVVSDVVFKVQ